MRWLYTITGGIIPVMMLVVSLLEKKGIVSVFSTGHGDKEREKMQEKAAKLLTPLGSALIVMDIMLFSALKMMNNGAKAIVLVLLIAVELFMLISVWIQVHKENKDNSEMVEMKAYAKINLTLNVGKKREDGFHEVKTVMTGIGLHDDLIIRKIDQQEIVVKSEGYDVPNDENNLCCKAARAFFEYTGMDVQGMEIILKKGVPVGAGMGGGSSDAAAVLRAMKKLFKPDIEIEELEKIAGRIGSDIAFLVRGGTALGIGKGEILTPMPEMPSYPMVVCKPPVSYSTKEMYARLDEAGVCIETDEKKLEEALKDADLDVICAQMSNSFEYALPENSPCLTIRDTLLVNGAKGAMLSGSGSAVFGIFEDEMTAKKAYEVLKVQYQDTFMTVSKDQTAW